MMLLLLSDPRATLRRMSPGSPDASDLPASPALAALTLDRWRSFDPATARRVADEAAHLVHGRLIGVETVEHLGGPSTARGSSGTGRSSP